MMLMAVTFFKTNSVKAQTNTADSALTVTDTSITTPNNIVVTDSSGNTTLFAGGQQSDYAGKVGVGTSTPSDKLSIVDTINPAISVSNTKLKYQFEIKRARTNNKFKDGDLFIGYTNIDTLPITVSGNKSANKSSFGGEENRSCDECENYSLPSTYISSAGAIYFETKGCDLRSNDILTLCAHVASVRGQFLVYDDNNYPIFEVNNLDGITYAREIKVQATPFPPDFVFNKDYKMMSLYDLEQYVNVNHHLPEIPSAAEQTANGINVAQMQAKLLQKVEELTLIIIEQNKRIEELEKQGKH
jgi:hypothetical protein